MSLKISDSSGNRLKNAMKAATVTSRQIIAITNPFAFRSAIHVF